MSFSTLLISSSMLGCWAQGKLNPFELDSKLLVVGAGPSGVHMASHLKALGYRHVTLFERTHRVGGKSYTLYRDTNGQQCEQKKDASGRVNSDECIAHEMGTCFMHRGYHLVRNLIQEYGLTPEVSPNGRTIFSEVAPGGLGLEVFMGGAIMSDIAKGAIVPPPGTNGANPKEMVIATLVSAVQKYNELHADIFGKVEFTMPSRLNDSAMHRINMSFGEYLVSNGMRALVPFMTIGFSAQGYGHIIDAPAYYGLMWITPELTNALVEEVTKDSEDILTMMPEGFQKLWTTMVERDALDVRFGVEIAQNGIDRQLSDREGGVKVSYRQDAGAWKTEEFDFLLYTAPFAHANKYVKDLTRPEHDIFDKLESSVLTTTLYRSGGKDFYVNGSAIMYNVTSMGSSAFDGGWYADRNDPRLFGASEKDTNLRVAYQYVHNYCNYDSVLCDSDRTPDPKFQNSQVLKGKLSADLATEGVTAVQLQEQFAWPYFHRFNAESIAAGLPWDLFEMQGSDKTWWLGASASFESVHDVLNYNMMMIKKYLKTSSESDMSLSAGILV